MENSIINDINIAIQISMEKYIKDETIKEFEDAYKEYLILVEKGLTKMRGYNLMTITDIHLHRLNFNIIDENANNIQDPTMQVLIANF